MYKCDICGVLSPNEINYVKDWEYNEVYVTCKCCGSECTEYHKEEEEEEYAEEAC